MTHPSASPTVTSQMTACRSCGTTLQHVMVDLGMSPLCESYVPAERVHEAEMFYPLTVYVCHTCYLAQLAEEISASAIFSEYAYFSSYSDSWVEHARQYTEMVIKRFGLGPQSKVVEIASNDGYLLQHFTKHAIPILGIEPAANVAEAAKQKNVPTIVAFFGTELASDLARRGEQADLLLGNNVLAQVPQLNDFVQGMICLLKPNGVITMEFPHLQRLLRENQFDTIYHEHYSYFSLIAVEQIFARHGLRIFDVEELPTHGGSLRIYACHEENRQLPTSANVVSIREAETADGFRTIERYLSFGRQVRETKAKLLRLLIDLKTDGKIIAGYGAPGKGNTLLNYCGIKTDFIDYTVDRNPYKQGKYLPGSRIPIYSPEKIAATRPDYVFILPWNLQTEIMKQLSYIREWGGQFILPIPEARIQP